MRILFVWLTAFGLMGMLSIAWWTSQPLVIGLARSLNSSITMQEGRNVATIIEYASYWWGPILVLVVLIWAIISSAKYDTESSAYG